MQSMAARTIDADYFELTKAQKHIDMGAVLIAEQQARLEAKRRCGLDTAEAAATLALLQHTQDLFVAERDRLLRDFGAARGARLASPSPNRQRKQGAHNADLEKGRDQEAR